MLLTASNHDLKRQSARIDNGVDFGRQHSTRTSKAFTVIFLDETYVLMGAHYRAVDHLHLGIVSMRDSSQDTIPNACATPTHKTIVAGV